MKDAAIRITNLRKSFLLSHSGVGSVKTLLLWWRTRALERLEVLRGISFEVSRGESVAIVGRNGAGKSTLLSLLARVYKPTEGKVEVNGRVAPLLELGAGFHPDLTGVENVFFNGVILGLTRREITRRIDRIVEFSELDKHIDAPVRTFSSGMLARLGFAVAAHVDAEILLVDEVLAVGDQAFQEKCFAKIDEFRAGGGSILFVSHKREDIERVADRCIWVSRGLIRAEGTPKDIMDQYSLGGEDLKEEL